MPALAPLIPLVLGGLGLLLGFNRRRKASGSGSATGSTSGSGGSTPSTPLGDRVPDAPSIPDDSTGISGPLSQNLDADIAELRGTQNRTPEQRAELKALEERRDNPNAPQTTEELGQGVVTAFEETAEGQQAAQEEDQARGNELADEVRSDKEETVEAIDETREDLQESEARFQENIEGASEQIQAIPTEVTNEFDRLRDEFGDAADASFDRIDDQRTDALANTDRGRAAAMQAAVQGIQGNVNTQVAQIMSNPNLTSAQKQGMVAQVRLSGASSMAPAIGATVLAFNQLSADVATKFGAITGQLESTVLQGTAQLAGLQGQAFTTAQIAVGQMTTQLLEIDANASVGFANAQTQLLATRSHATMTGNDILLRTLPEQSTPYLDLTGAATAAYEIGRDLMMSQWEMDMGGFGMELQIAMIRSMQGSPMSNALEAFLNGLSQGGLAQGIFGGIAAAAGSGGQQTRI